MCVQLSVQCEPVSVCQRKKEQHREEKKKKKKERLELVNVLIQNIFTSHEHDCNFKPLGESSCAALTGRR